MTVTDRDISVDTSDYSVVIPTVRPTVRTKRTISDAPEVVVRRDRGLNVARNRGVEEASHDWIVLVDDDISFPEKTVKEVIPKMDRSTLVGLADFEPLRWVIGRLMIFHRSLWRAVGGFDESRHHGGDTDFAIRVEKAGGEIRQLDRDAVVHHDTDTGEYMGFVGHLEWMTYLTRKHPRTFLPVAARLVHNKLRK